MKKIPVCLIITTNKGKKIFLMETLVWCASELFLGYCLVNKWYTNTFYVIQTQYIFLIEMGELYMHTHTHTHANIHMHTMHHTCSQKPKFEFLFVLQHVRMGSKNLGRYITFIFHCIRKYLSIYIARCVHVCMCMFQFLLKLIVMIGNLTICTIAMVDSSLNYNNDTK